VRQLQSAFQLFPRLGSAPNRGLSVAGLICVLSILTHSAAGTAQTTAWTIASNPIKSSEFSQTNLKPTQQLGETAAQLKQAQLKQTAQQGFLADGVYLYGQSPEPEKLGLAYMVFEVRQGRTVGAFYMPQSSFDCFYGQVQAKQMALTVVDSYDRRSHSFEIARQSNATVAGNQGAVTQGFAGYYRLADLSANDRRILDVCRAQYQNQI